MSDPSDERRSEDRHLPRLDERSYELLATRALQYDEMMWQVPALSLTAQAFLFTTALGPAGPGGRLVAALLSTVIAVISVQLMAKQRYLQLIDTVWLHHQELLTYENEVITVFSSSRERGKLIESNDLWPRARRISALRLGRFVAQSSFEIWTLGLAIFGLVAAGVALFAFVELLNTW